MTSYLITGAGRGLGLELAAQLASLPTSQVSTVFAAIRSSTPPSALQTLIDHSKGRVIALTSTVVTDRASLDKAAAQVEALLNGKGLDVLINNAGVMPPAFKGIAKMDNLRYAFEVNVEAVHETTSAFLPLLKKGTGKKVVNISTTLGSMDHAPKYKWAPFPAYKISKTALNMLTVQWAQEYAEEGFTVFAVTPGWLKTDLGTENADLDVSVGAKATLHVIGNSTTEDNGTFRNILVPGWENTDGPNQYDGKIVPW
ncbi:short-chain dehydrogenase-like protein [Exophiala viscosa]|uniref:Short-chain dehydrogenase-like protein n=1 Tax=Exophiala viscosa TaxID=2486360 RepID=A0AAN6E386_9EURO|nr:short-chain dehydrogenase-like protein [Exophiala viscosa]